METTDPVYHFPFGQKLTKVEQTDRSPKKAFVLGVYASAVHARWVDANGKQKVVALAVASEPYIFWKGDNASEIISSIQIPRELGRLTVPTNDVLNGPSGIALDKKFLHPLNLSRQNTWLCDLLPQSRVNEQQRKAIDKHYNVVAGKYNLPEATVPDFKKSDLNSVDRRKEILQELEASNADTLILLGDLPIYWFLRFYCGRGFTKLSDFGISNDSYGRPHEMKINDKPYNVVGLCHPRQADKLGRSSRIWGDLHEGWMNDRHKWTVQS